MLDKFKTELFNENDNVLVGFSGGADSTALLLNLYELKNEKNLKLTAIHVNHCLRGAESDRDEEFCINLCNKLGIDIIVEKVNVTDYCKAHCLSTEEGARDLRYKAFEKHSNGVKIATAHNLYDNAETMIFNLARGTGLKGVCGIPETRDNIVRPMLSVSREEILDYLDRINQDYVTDSTNLCTDYSRNKIRKQVLPVLKEINSGAMVSLKNTSDILKDEEDYLEIQSQTALNDCRVSDNKLDYVKLATYHKALIRRVIILFLDKQKIKVNYKRILLIENYLVNNTYCKINLTENVYLILKSGIISVVQLDKDYKKIFIKAKMGYNQFIDKSVYLSIIEDEIKWNKEIVNKNFANFYIDYDKIQGDIALRNRRKGDKIRLEGKDFTTSVKKLFNQKVSLEEREKIIFVCDGDGIIAIQNIGIADRVKVDKNTKKVLKLEINIGEV